MEEIQERIKHNKNIQYFEKGRLRNYYFSSGLNGRSHTTFASVCLRRSRIFSCRVQNLTAVTGNKFSAGLSASLLGLN